MKVEIWSDIMCPFCYIGKRRLEEALARFPHADQVQVQWRSFELDPNLQTNPGQSIHELLAERKGVSVEQGRQMNAQMAQHATTVGLEFNFDKTIPANTFNAHRLIHLAAAHQRQDAMKERILRAYFTEGLNIDDPATLTRLAAEVALPEAEVAQLWQTDAYAQEVRHDEYQARQIGVRGVPYFVFADKYAVSGAQPSELFEEVLEKVWEEARPMPVQVAGPDGTACGLDGSAC
ncbi:Predicted dithiol-disulfide isomerase, DsbA family [Hymenobacter daecheongensis DSM 21074]|uniref:Predicted dithiol-disulfide isomerase, DsbA family n=1 Tax=Hymenobacter daecheongensis DSM 21074 TaxID=1121955 RepID=A0A1M6LAH6_9BACT|nr:DsbA family oxidoreductase [Hymenobacter daecheongensis]SHJ68210.1 Predicted dithiol-disulfide isomerase, DsbA family [Hymenobacter daecheongensis DSM 21074]